MCFGAFRSALVCSGFHAQRFGLLPSVLVCSCAECLIVSQPNGDGSPSSFSGDVPLSRSGLERLLEPLPGIVEDDRAGIERVPVIDAANPLDHRLVLGMAAIGNPHSRGCRRNPLADSVSRQRRIGGT